MGYPDDVPVLTDGEVTLRAYTLDDVDGCVENCNDPETVAWTLIPVPYGRDDAIEWITETVPRGWRDGTALEFAIEAAHPDGVRRFSGGITIRPRQERRGDIGYAVHPAVRGRGVSRRAIKLIVDWAFAEREIDVITWSADVGNWASRRVVWAVGFTIDATIAQFHFQRGVRKDAWFGTLRKSDTREPRNVWWDPPVLESERLRLRPFADSDADRLMEMVRDERSQHFGGRVKGVLQSDGAAQLLRIREANATGRLINWCIADRSTDLLVGHIQYFDLEGLDDSEVKPGYSIHPDSRGRGYLTEALRTLIPWTFRPVSDGGFGKRMITISTAASNKASRHAAEQAGFTHVATHPTAFTIGPQDFDDEVIYQVTNPAWHP